LRNWKTTTAGIVALACGFVTFSPELFARWPLAIALAKYAMVGGFASVGILAKDASK
jgi:hypothetical protein